MRRRTLLSMLPLLLAGCGGHGGSPEGDATPVRTASINGDSTLDLAVSGGDDTAMAGTGSAYGSLTVPDESRGAIRLEATLPSGPVVQNQQPYQGLELQVAGEKALAVGTTFRLDGKTNTLAYAESFYAVEGPDAGDGGGHRWTATRGTAEVVGLTAASVTLRLSGVTLATDSLTDKRVVTLSGTVTGTIVAGAA